MAPKTEIRNKLADALDADLSALSDINILLSNGFIM